MAAVQPWYDPFTRWLVCELARRTTTEGAVKVDVPDELGLTEGEARLNLAVGLYTAERISLAKAARLVGLSRIAFQHLLADRGIPIQYDQDDVQHDVDTLTQLGQL